MLLIELEALKERLENKRSKPEAGKFYENYVYSREDHKTVLQIVETFLNRKRKKKIHL